MKEPDYKKCSLLQLFQLSCNATSDKVAEKSFELYLRRGGNYFECLSKYGKTDRIAEEAFELHIERGGGDFEILIKSGKTRKIRKRAKLLFADIREFLIK